MQETVPRLKQALVASRTFEESSAERMVASGRDLRGDVMRLM